MSTQIYDHSQVEVRWQQFWEEGKLFQNSTHLTKQEQEKEKIYLLFAFAYPSGSGLHVGHVESKTALDILARYYRMAGKQVFFPVGWDAFGLPAENYAIKTGIPPEKTTIDAIHTFRRQIKRLGISYDWANEIATSHPEYYKWTQWIFIQLYKKGLAYQKMGAVNWCPSCQTVLANEQVVAGACERCGTEVIQKDMKQWFFKITKYKDELISGLDQVDWPEATKSQQLNWIGRKHGINIRYAVDKTSEEVVCFTTRPDTNFGATFIVLAPEHPLAHQVASGAVTTPQQKTGTAQAVAEYIEEARKKTELQRQQEGRKKTGVFTGLYAINPLTNTQIPIWVSDFVLSGFGTGALVGVPGHDRRDFEFAQAMELDVIRVVVGANGDTSPITAITQVEEDPGTAINSGFLDGMDTATALEAIMKHLEEIGHGQVVTTYKLRDWLISRQRYWGAPIPVVYDPDGQAHLVKEEHLPWMLPTDVDFNPTGESPLKSSKELQQRVETLYGKGWTPEYDTMDTFVDSSWYFLRYTDARNQQKFASTEHIQHWLPVDFYMIGPEHIVLHLLYSRFFTKFLRDEGYLQFDEPFMKMRHQGMILGPDHKKMSKSKGNVINPDEIIEKFGADTLRMYEMFMGPIEADKPWDIRAVAGMYRFLQRVYKQITQSQYQSNIADNPTFIQRKIHQTIKKVTQDIEQLKFNTAIACLMELLNAWEKEPNKKTAITWDDAVAVVKILAPFAPFMAEELYHILVTSKHDGDTYASVHTQQWPSYDKEWAREEVLIIPVQINGKVRAQLEVPATAFANKLELLAQARALPQVQKWLADKPLRKEIYVPGKIISFAV